MFSATFPEAIQRLAGTFLHNYLFLAVGIVGGACSDVEQKFYQVSKFQKRDRLNEILESIGLFINITIKYLLMIFHVFAMDVQSDYMVVI